jgi:hypothetical protein
VPLIGKFCKEQWGSTDAWGGEESWGRTAAGGGEESAQLSMDERAVECVHALLDQSSLVMRRNRANVGEYDRDALLH